MQELVCNVHVDEIPLQDPHTDLGREWESLLVQNEYSGFMQSLHWARFKKASGQTVIHLVVKDQERIIAGALIYTSPDDRKPTIFVSPYGPVIPWDDPLLSRRCLQLLLEKSKHLARKLNAVMWRIEPRLPLPIPGVLHEFARGAVDLVPAETMYVDLSVDESELLSLMKPKCRYNIRLSQRRGVVVREETSANAATVLYSMLYKASQRDDFYLEHEEFFKTLVTSLQNCGILRVLVAEHDGIVLGALALIVHGRKAAYLYGGIGNEKRQFMPGYALQWHALCKAKELGCLTYDFYGYDQFQSPQNPYALFSKFKSGFGGRVCRFIGAQDYVFMDELVDNVVGFFKDVSSVCENS